MAVKLNKEALLKNRFWILLAVTSCMTVFGIVYLQMVNADQLRSEIKKVTDSGKSLTGAQGPTSVAAWEKYAEEAKGNESKIWSNGYLAQRDLYKWSKEVEERFNFFDGKFANEISVLKVAPKDDWPADTENLVHGVMTEITKDYIKLTTRPKKDDAKKTKPANEVTIIFRTETVKITSEDGGAAMLWEQGLPQGKGKVLAVKYQTGKYFNDVLRGDEQRVFADSYRSQIHELLESVDPLDTKGNGVVQFRNWLYDPGTDPAANDRFVRWVPIEWKFAGNMSTEAWIAQEDIWVQRELYRIIKSVNDDIKVYKGAGGEDRGKPYVFKNTNLQLTLTLYKDDSLKFVIKNLQPHRQKLDIDFRVNMNKGAGAAPEPIKISTKALMPVGTAGDTWEETRNPTTDGKNPKRRGIYGVEQVLSWEGAAIKRIDHISIGSEGGDDLAHSHRTFPDGLKPLVAKVVKDEGGDKKGGDGLGKFMGGMGGAGGKQNAGNKDVLDHGLWTDRYVEVSPQSRRLPVAVVLIVDQVYVNRVLNAFNNSKLRFLETQVLLNHYTNSLQPPTVEKKDDGGGGPPRFGGGGKPFMPMPGGFGGGFGGFGGGGAVPPPAGGQELGANMELVIYGIVTLYQRYPPRPDAKTTP